MYLVGGLPGNCQPQTSKIGRLGFMPGPGSFTWAQTKQAIAVKVTRVIAAVASNKNQNGAAMLHSKENIKMIPRNRDTTISLQKQGPFDLFKKQLSILRQLLQSNAYATKVYTYILR